MNKQKGFIGLVTILLVSAIALLIGSTILLKSITEATLSSDEEFSNQAWATVNACAEHALINLALASTTGFDEEISGWNYAGDEEVEVVASGNSCYIYNIDISSGTSTGSRTVNASSTVNDFTRKLTLIVSTNTPAVIIDSWTEVADFDF